jgi:hypothetical protein
VEGGVSMMYSSKYIRKNLFQRFSEFHAAEEIPPKILLEDDLQNPAHLSQFFKTAEHRKRQILEKMLMD